MEDETLSVVSMAFSTCILAKLSGYWETRNLWWNGKSKCTMKKNKVCAMAGTMWHTIKKIAIKFTWWLKCDHCDSVKMQYRF